MYPRGVRTYASVYPHCTPTAHTEKWFNYDVFSATTAVFDYVIGHRSRKNCQLTDSFFLGARNLKAVQGMSEQLLASLTK